MSNPDFNKPELPPMGIVSELDDADRVLLSDYGEFLPVQDGATMITEGAPQKSLYFLISGILHVHTEREGSRTLVGRIEPGETIGEIAVFDPGPASANVTAKGFCQVWKASADDLNAFMEAYPEAAGRLLVSLVAEMSRRIRFMNDKLATADLGASLGKFAK
jgi:CRP-like cAMP-binding protein